MVKVKVKLMEKVKVKLMEKVKLTVVVIVYEVVFDAGSRVTDVDAQCVVVRLTAPSYVECTCKHCSH